MACRRDEIGRLVAHYHCALLLSGALLGPVSIPYFAWITTLLERVLPSLVSK